MGLARVENLTVIPFHQSMFPDDVMLFRHVAVTGSQGASRRTFPTPGIPLKAAVVSSKVDRADADGRVTTMTMHSIATTSDLQAKADDKFEWLGRTLAVEGTTIPKGFGDVIWITTCVETK